MILQTLWYVRQTRLRCCLTRLAAYRGTLRHVRCAGLREKDETFYVSVHKTTSRQFAVIYLASATTS